MALEPKTISAEEAPNEELISMTRRFWVSLALTLPVLLLAMGEMLGIVRGLSPRVIEWIQLVLTTPVVLWGGWPFFERGWFSIVHLQLNMFTLIAIGTGTAYVYSIAATLAPAAFPAGFRSAGGEVPVYFEAAAVITTLVLLGQVLELRARSRTSAAIRGLLQLAPKTARRVSRRWRRSRTFRWNKSCTATACAFGPANACPSTAWCSKARVRWTSRC